MLRFDPFAWHSCVEHDPQTCSESANCYSYILNNPHYCWAVPGLGFAKSTPGKFFDSFNDYFKDCSVDDFRKTLMSGAVTDGLVKIQEPEVRKGYYLVALVFADNGNDFDFHWYRQDTDDSWSHKNGWGAVTNRSDTGTEISDPRVAVNREFPVFGSFFLVPSSGVTLQRTFPISPN